MEAGQRDPREPRPEPATEPGSAAPNEGDERSTADPAREDEREGLDPAEEERSAREQALVFWDELGARVDSEQVDPAWRRDTEPVITRVVSAELGPEVRVDQVFCAASVCRATLSHPGWPRIPNDKLVQFAMNRESLGTMEMQLDAREQGTSTLYFLRP